jgi:hypothetical protein
MTVEIRIQSDVLEDTRRDLRRPHAFAAERVGFFTCRPSVVGKSDLLLNVSGYQPLADEDYLRDPSVGAMMGSSGIRKALQIALSTGSSMFHVHMHEHSGVPRFSRVDVTEARKFVPDFFNVAPQMPHGIIVLSHDSAYGLCWRARTAEPVQVDTIVSVGAPIRSFWA